MLTDRILSSIALTLAVASTALAQDGGAAPATPAPQAAPAAPSKGFTGTISGDNVYVRSGPSASSAYPFGRLKQGDVVDVEEESFGWAKVRTRGPAFQGIYGYVLANDKVTLSADSKTLTAVSATEVRAPNIGADGNPDASFKAIGQLAAGDTLAVVGSVRGDREQVHKVALPPTATGWVNINFVRRASQGESKAIADAPKAPAQAPIGAPAGGETVQAIEAGSNAAVDSKAAPGGTVTVDVAPNGDATKAEGKKKTEAAPPPPPVKTEAEIAAEKRRALFNDLEAAWLKVKAEPAASSEIAPLKSRYEALAAEPGCEASLKGMSEARIKQLDLLARGQALAQELEKAKAATDAQREELRKFKIALEARSDYTAVGVLNASTVYDGKGLPLLFRVTDPATGQSVAYIAPKDPNTLTTMLGLMVGVRGTKRYEQGLKLDVIDPGSIDILTNRKDGQVQRVEMNPAKPAPAPAAPGANAQK